jgi:hypothetical protein
VKNDDDRLVGLPYCNTWDAMNRAIDRDNASSGFLGVIVGFAIVAAVLAIGLYVLSNSTDRNEAVVATISRLNHFAHDAVILAAHGVHFDQLHSLDDFLVHAKQFCLISEEECQTKVFAFDAWNRPYHWWIERRKSATIVRISSNGKDGVSQHGEQDDLYVELLIDNSRVTVTIKVPRGMKRQFPIDGVQVID